MELNNSDFTRLNLSTKMVKVIQRIQKQCSEDLIIEERLDQNESLNEEDDIKDHLSTQSSNIYESINLDKVN